ncbi:unnamed protein product, partial [Prorocentrum cordatum]
VAASGPGRRAADGSRAGRAVRRLPPRIQPVAAAGGALGPARPRRAVRAAERPGAGPERPGERELARDGESLRGPHRRRAEGALRLPVGRVGPPCARRVLPEAARPRRPPGRGPGPARGGGLDGAAGVGQARALPGHVWLLLGGRRHRRARDAHGDRARQRLGALLRADPPLHPEPAQLRGPGRLWGCDVGAGLRVRQGARHRRRPLRRGRLRCPRRRPRARDGLRVREAPGEPGDAVDGGRGVARPRRRGRRRLELVPVREWRLHRVRRVTP